MPVAIWWLRRDFRLSDNPALHAARSLAKTVYAAFCLDELEGLNPRQRAFAVGSLVQLRSEIEKSDATVSALGGTPSGALLAACKRLGAVAVVAARSYDAAARDVESEVERALLGEGIELIRAPGDVLHEPEIVAERKRAADGGYRVFPPFYDAWRALKVGEPLSQTLPNGRDPQPGAFPDVPDVAEPKPGERAASDQQRRFVSARAASYAFMGAYPAADGTSKLSAYLRFGCLSPRALHRAVHERMAKSWTLAPERAAMTEFLRRLALRDFFMQLAYFEPRMHDEPLQAKMRGFPYAQDERLLSVWREGRTGYPLVDAAMRQLAASGYVHQRAATCAASFCCFDLGLDWRAGRDVWMSELLAADPALCDGNWQWIAGVGSDQAAYPRVYNPITQSRLIDPQSVYVRRWVRELAKLPTGAALTPWALSRQQQTELGFFTPEQYPPPVVDHRSAARAMLSKYQSFRQRS